MLSDNGLEFEGAFGRLLKAKGPKMNAHVERFNRTVQEEFLIYHEDLCSGATAPTWPC